MSLRPPLVTAAATSVLLFSVGCAAGSQESVSIDSATMIVPTEPGGGQDLMGRTVAAGLEKIQDGLTIGIENRPGGSTVTGYSALLAQEGNASYLATATTGLISMPLTIETPYTWRDFTPVAIIGEDLEIAVVSGDSPYDNLNDVVEAASTGDLTVAVAGATGPDAIVTELVEDASGVTFNEVVFQSGAESTAAVLAGDADIMMTNPSEVLGQLQSGDLKAVAMFSEERAEGSELLADIPTAEEQGIDATFSMFRALIAPGGVSDTDLDFWINGLEEWTGTDEYETYVEDNSLAAMFVVGAELETYLENYEKMLDGVLG